MTTATSSRSRERKGCVLALDVGGSSVKSGWIDGNHTARGPILETPIDSQGEPARVIGALAQVIDGHLQSMPPEMRRGIAMGFPGPFDYSRGVCLMRGLGKFDNLFGCGVGELLAAAIPQAGMQIRFGPDAEMAILGEARYGMVSRYERIVGVTLGTGLGSAFVEGGDSVRKGDGVPSEGLLYAEPWREGMADESFSTRGLLARLRLAGCAVSSLAEAASRAREGDENARSAFREFGHDLGSFLVPYVAAFRAEAVTCLGGISRAGDLFFPSAQRVLGVPVVGPSTPVPAALLGLSDLFSEPVN